MACLHVLWWTGKERKSVRESEASAVEPPHLGDGPNTVSESTVSNTELSEFFGAH